MKPAPIPRDIAAPPRVGSVKPYHPPKTTGFTLRNGLEVQLITDRRYPLVTARLGLRRGASFLPAEEAGALDALTDLLTEGAGRRNAREIAEEADAIGGEIGAAAAQDFVVLRAFALSEHTGRLLDLLREVALEPTFPEHEVALRRQNMLHELEISLSQPSFLSGVLFAEKLYGAHPYAIISPTRRSIQEITRERLIEIHDHIFTPNLAVLTLTGDIDPKTARAEIEKRFVGWKPRNMPPQKNPAPPEQAPRRVYLADRPGSSQTDLRLGNLAARESDPDYFPLVVLNNALGGSFASRLMTDLREQRGFTYGIGTHLSPRLELGAFELSTQVRTEVTGETLKIILEHFNRIRTEPLSNEELEKAKNVLAGKFVRRMETQEGAADQFLKVKLYGLPENYLETYVKRIQTVTAGQALQAARRNILPERLIVAAAGDASKIAEGLSAFSSAPLSKETVSGD